MKKQRIPYKPLRFDVVLSRISGKPDSNVPHTVVWHSRTGFDWGNGGSGAADLALNILNAYFPPGCDDYTPVQCEQGKASRTAVDLHQAFKWHFLAKLPREGGTIQASQIMQWVNTNLRDAGLLPA